MDSIIAINNFMKKNKISPNEYGNLYFKAFIEYRTPIRNTSALTEVKITRNGYDDGKIEIMESNDLTSSYYHLESKTQFQKYSFKDDKLLVKGSSLKMGGEYTITISKI